MKVALIGLLFFLLTQGCVTEHTVHVAPAPIPPERAMLSHAQDAILLIRARGENQGRLWYQGRFDAWVLEEEPMVMVMKAIEAELKSMGYAVTREGPKTPPRLEIELRWFGPYGHSPLTAAVIMAFALYPAESNEPVWRGKVQAGEYVNQEMVDPENEAAVIGEIISKALYDALTQLKWKPDFLQAISVVLTRSVQSNQNKGAE